MEDAEFIHRIREKIERLTATSVELDIDHNDPQQFQVDFSLEVPRVVLGANVYEYSGFARMCVEYAVASIRQQRPIEMMEFHLLLSRN